MRPTQRIICILSAILAIPVSATTVKGPGSSETTKIEPELIYRQASITPRKHSAFYREDTMKDYADQLYLSLRFSRSYDYQHEIVVSPVFYTRRNDPSEQEFRVDEAYIDSHLTEHFGIIAGKRREDWGSGYVVNPSDLINENEDMIDPLNQKEGDVFTRLYWQDTTWSLGLAFARSESRDAKEGRGWLTFKTTAFDTDIQLQQMMQQTEKGTTGWSFSRFFGDIFELHWDGRTQRRQHSTSPERAYSSYEQKDPSQMHLVGSRIVVGSKRSIVVEGIQNESGLLPSELENYFKAQKQATKEGQTPDEPFTYITGRHYAFLAYNDEGLIPRTRIGANALMNLDDKSSFSSLVLEFHPSSITSLAYTPLFFAGSELSEFGEQPASQVHYLVISGRF